jgi:hypothetical protein
MTMSAKKVWISLLQKEEKTAQKIMQQISSYGLIVNGHFWSVNMEKMEWMSPRPELLDKDVAVWLIAGTKADFADANVRFGLSLLSLTVQATRGHGFPIIIIQGGKEAVTVEELPTPLKHAQIVPADSAFGPKIVARANVPFKPTAVDYRIDVYGLAGLGIWLEVGPAKDTWKGIMAGVSGGDIDAHGVGPKGQLPMDKMVINYAMKGMKLNLGDKEYLAWAVQNEIDPNTSYFVRIRQQPDSIIFGQFSQTDDAEVFVLKIV